MLTPWAAPALLTDTQHVYAARDGHRLVLDKVRGGDQGDALVSLVFPLTYRRVSRNVVATAAALDKDARGYTYQDDFEMVCTVSAAET
eukprot:415125-Alexandrium_andersonii.AAC.1